MHAILFPPPPVFPYISYIPAVYLVVNDHAFICYIG